MTNVVITMAGVSKRFRDAGYERPKYELEVHGRTVFEWSLISIRSWLEEPHQLVFVGRREEEAGAFVGQATSRLGITAYDLVVLEEETDGQATTALEATRVLRDADAPLLIYNVDTHVAPDALSPEMASGAGWLPVFPGKGTAWSFVLPDQDGFVGEVWEKVRVSDLATIGLYWFSSSRLYAQTYDTHFSGLPEDEPFGERFIAPMYNSLSSKGECVSFTKLEATDVIPLGTPAEFEAFISREATFPPLRA